MDKFGLGDVSNYLNVKEIAYIIGTLTGVTIGRVAFWIHRKQRKPTWIELLAEPVIILVVGLSSAGFLALFDIENNLAYAGAGALGGTYGLRSLDFAIKITATKMGYKNLDICPIDESLKSHNEGDK